VVTVVTVATVAIIDLLPVVVYPFPAVVQVVMMVCLTAAPQGRGSVLHYLQLNVCVMIGDL
jgi:hypothetical protein